MPPLISTQSYTFSSLVFSSLRWSWLYNTITVPITKQATPCLLLHLHSFFSFLYSPLLSLLPVINSFYFLLFAFLSFLLSSNQYFSRKCENNYSTFYFTFFNFFFLFLQTHNPSSALTMVRPPTIFHHRKPLPSFSNPPLSEKYVSTAPIPQS